MRIIFLALGLTFTSLGILGIALPLLPTTPFLLLALWCFSRSSEKMKLWLLENRYFGHYLSDYREKKGIKVGVKVWALSVLWATIISSAIWATDNWWVRALLVAIAIGVTIHISMLKTLREDE